jgi:hypothetical protein
LIKIKCVCDGLLINEEHFILLQFPYIKNIRAAGRLGNQMAVQPL